MKTKLFTLAMSIALLASCSEKKAENNDKGIAKPQVKLATVQSQDIPQTETYTATVESDIKNNIAPNIAYRIEKIEVEVGDNVRKGQRLVIMDESSTQQLKMQVASQEAVVSNVETDFNRIEQLYNVGGVSKAEYDNAQVQLVSQKSQLNVLKTQLELLTKNTILVSPIDGVVTARNYDNGDMYGVQPILVVEQTNPVKLNINISEAHYKDIHKGQEVEIAVDAYNDQTFTGKITVITPSIDAATHTFQVEITINNKDQKVRPGMFARATVNFGTQNHVVIPDEALVKQIGAGDRYIYVYNPKDGTVSYNKVELGKHMGKFYEIFSGANAGDQIVIAGQARLNNGKEVEVVK